MASMGAIGGPQGRLKAKRPPTLSDYQSTQLKETESTVRSRTPASYMLNVSRVATNTNWPNSWRPPPGIGSTPYGQFLAVLDFDSVSRCGCSESSFFPLDESVWIVLHPFCTHISANDMKRVNPGLDFAVFWLYVRKRRGAPRRTRTAGTRFRNCIRCVRVGPLKCAASLTRCGIIMVDVRACSSLF
jgi:hypothetical protein